MISDMKILKYAYDAAIAKWWRYDRIATASRRAETLAHKLASEAMDDVNEISRLIVAEEKRQRLSADLTAELKDLVKPETQQAQAVPLNWSVNVEFVSGRRSCFRHKEEDIARTMYEFSKKEAVGEFKGQISRVSLTQHNSDDSETVLSSMDIG